MIEQKTTPAATPYMESTPTVRDRAVPPPGGGRGFASKSAFVPKKTWASHSQQALELGCKFLRARQGGIVILSSEGELMEHLGRGPVAKDFGHQEGSSWFLDLMQAIAEQTSPTRMTSVADRAAGRPDQPSAEFVLGPLVAVSFACPSRCRGVFYFSRNEGEPAFSAEDENTVLTLCSWVEQGNLIDENKLLSQLHLLNTVAQAAAGNLDLGQILAVSLRELDRYLPLHVTAVWLVEKEGHTAGAALSSDHPMDQRGPQANPVAAKPNRQFQAREETSDNRGDAKSLRPLDSSLVLAELSGGFMERARSNGLTPGFRLPLDQTPFESCLTEGQPLFADRTRAPGSWQEDAKFDSLDVAMYLAEAGATSCFAVPLRAGDRTVGILHSVCTRPSGFVVEQIQLLYLVADLIGPAISNCQLFAHLSQAYDKLRMTQSQLIQAEKMRAIGELASGMAHEFNNSLCGVLGFMELALLNSNLDPATRGHLESGRTCAFDAAQVVRRVQNFSRKQRKDDGFVPLEINDLVKQTLELVRHKWENLARARGTPVQVEIQTGDLAMVRGNAPELREVLTNLVFNAVDAMPQGGQLFLRTWTLGKDFFLTVRDTGVGMTEAVRQRIFEPFFTTKGERGNGLGLSVVFGIIKRHGGDIQVESQICQGTTFTLRMPLTTDVTKNTAGSSTSQETVNPTRSLRILVVEDEDSIRRFLQSCLTSMGHKPHVTADAPEALTAFAQEPFDVVLTDLGLPGVSGEEVARVVSRKVPAVPVVLLTGWADQLQAESQSLEGVTCILSKPISLATLASTLKVVCPS